MSSPADTNNPQLGTHQEWADRHDVTNLGGAPRGRWNYLTTQQSGAIHCPYRGYEGAIGWGRDAGASWRPWGWISPLCRVSQLVPLQTRGEIEPEVIAAVVAKASKSRSPNL